MVSSVDRAKRALVSLLLRLAKLYAVLLDISRESTDADTRRSFKKVSRKTHPDRGGSGEHQQSLSTTRIRHGSKRSEMPRNAGEDASVQLQRHLKMHRVRCCHYGPRRRARRTSAFKVPLFC